MARLVTDDYSVLELFVKSEKDEKGYIKLIGAGNEERIYEAGAGFYKWLKIPLTQDTEYDILVKNCKVGLGYLSGCADILDKGICYLKIGDTVRKIIGAELSEFYDTPYREQYHFVPFMNWINDPNGLCWYKGYYHLFYQCNPFRQQWGQMYWGHAASKDLVHWVHLPIVFEPQEELRGDLQHKGGAFSGSAVPLEDEVKFYLTRHFGPMEDGADTVEWQTMSSSRDMLNFEPETDIIKDKPVGANYDFRDPKVVKMGDSWYMVLAGNLNGFSTIYLYKSADMLQWTYIGPLVTEPDQKATTFECPDFFMLDGKSVALGALMRHYDENGRYQMTRCYIGDFKDGEFQTESTQWFDFGSNFYAVQSFEHEGQRIAIGWISDFYGEHRILADGACGSFAIPRVLSVKHGRLHMEPVPEIFNLLDQKLYAGSENVCREIAGNCYYAKICLKDSTDFRILLGKEHDASISLVRENGGIRIQTAGTKTDHIDFAADVTEVRQLDIFVDRRTVEVFINQSEAAGTKLFYNDSKNGIFETKFPNTDLIESIEVFSMRSIW